MSLGAKEHLTGKYTLLSSLLCLGRDRNTKYILELFSGEQSRSSVLGWGGGKHGLISSNHSIALKMGGRLVNPIPALRCSVIQLPTQIANYRLSIPVDSEPGDSETLPGRTVGCRFCYPFLGYDLFCPNLSFNLVSFTVNFPEKLFK